MTIMANLTTLTTPDLISARTPARVAEAQRRLDSWNMSTKNVRRLTAFVGAKSAAAKKAPAIAAARPTGPGSRGGDPRRTEAFQFMLGERKAGRKCSYADACAKFGTTPARKG